LCIEYVWRGILNAADLRRKVAVLHRQTRSIPGFSQTNPSEKVSLAKF
jgi:hypothetical protein